MVEDVRIRQHHPRIPPETAALHRRAAAGRRALHQVPREALHPGLLRRRRSPAAVLRLDGLHPSLDVPERLRDDPAHLRRVGEGAASVEGRAAADASEHERLELAAGVLPPEAAELLRRLLDPLAREALLVDHLPALVHVGELPEAGEDSLRRQRRRPHLRHGVVLAVDDGAGVDAAERAELAHFLDQTLLPLLVRSLPLRIIAYESKGYFLPRHSLSLSLSSFFFFLMGLMNYVEIYI